PERTSVWPARPATPTFALVARIVCGIAEAAGDECEHHGHDNVLRSHRRHLGRRDRDASTRRST
ncbi:MAG: hypothetical protein K8M05_16595, partial [Deltaproteobacteria bacterium]|nr:hypothetical protein [Kofleriaceae bacterium]